MCTKVSSKECLTGLSLSALLGVKAAKNQGMFSVRFSTSSDGQKRCAVFVSRAPVGGPVDTSLPSCQRVRSVSLPCCVDSRCGNTSSFCNKHKTSSNSTQRGSRWWRGVVCSRGDGDAERWIILRTLLMGAIDSTCKSLSVAFCPTDCRARCSGTTQRDVMML